jgi:hypothetical protein
MLFYRLLYLTWQDMTNIKASTRRNPLLCFISDKLSLCLTEADWKKVSIGVQLPLFSCPATAVVSRERRFAQLPSTSLQDLMCCRDVYGVALFVHKCMKIADAAAVAAARQQPR